MALDPTACESNVMASIKKFLIDNLSTGEGYGLSFDKGLAVPKIQGEAAVTNWIAVQFGSMDTETLSSQGINIFVCTRKDKEGYELAQMRDVVMGYLTDSSQPDGTRRIPLYNSNAGRPWAKVGGMVIQLDPQSGQMTAEDKTKFKIIPIRLRWGAKI